jgi:hypothetical protein
MKQDDAFRILEFFVRRRIKIMNDCLLNIRKACGDSYSLAGSFLVVYHGFQDFVDRE